MARRTNLAWEGASSPFTYLSNFIKTNISKYKISIVDFSPANHKTEDASFVYLTTIVSKFHDTSYFKMAFHAFGLRALGICIKAVSAHTQNALVN